MGDENVFPSLGDAFGDGFTGRRLARHESYLVEISLVDGLPSRDDGPSMIFRHEDGSFAGHQFHRDGMHHRVGGPAKWFPQNGRARGSSEWWRRGKLHRIGAPAIESTHEPDRWYLNGRRYRSRDRALEALTGFGERRLRNALSETEFEVLLEDDAVDVPLIGVALGGGVTTVAGVRAVLDGTPVEWVKAFESGEISTFAVGVR